MIHIFSQFTISHYWAAHLLSVREECRDSFHPIPRFLLLDLWLPQPTATLPPPPPPRHKLKQLRRRRWRVVEHRHSFEIIHECDGTRAGEVAMVILLHVGYVSMLFVASNGCNNGIAPRSYCISVFAKETLR